MALTTKTIEHVKPGATRREIADTEVRGLYLIVQPSGVQSWAFRYRFEGRSRKLTIGQSPELGLKDARNLARKAHLNVAAGIDPGEQKRASKIAARAPVDLDIVERVAEQFLKRHAVHLAPMTQREINRVLAKEILPVWRGRKLSTITKAEIHHLLDTISDRPAPVVANRVLAWFRALCNWALGRGIIDASPCAGISLPEPEAPRDRVLSDDELAALWKASDALERPYNAFIQLLILTGQRRSEVSDLEWSEIDLDRHIWTLPARRAKNGTEHTIPLSETACAILAAIPRHYGSTYVFTVSGRKPIRNVYLIKARLDALLPPEMPPWVLHDVRRSVASGMAGLGVQLPVVEKLLNHVSGSFRGIVRVYQKHDFAREKAAAVEIWARHIETLLRGEADNIVPMRHGH